LQDVLGLGSEARMNVPSRSDGNWTWRCLPGALTAEMSERLAALAEVADRLPSTPAPEPHRQAAEEFAA